MFAVIETAIDQDSGERGSFCVYHNASKETADRAKRAFEHVELPGVTYSIKEVVPDQYNDCPECGEGLEEGPF